MDIKQTPAYELIKKEEIADIQSTGWLLRHKKSGARVLLLENTDDNKVFNIAFRTTPTNSTGVAHIMEHTVLCGSKHFPSKDPFVELVKGSMNTFLNAMTYPDKTMFPVASCNDTDFANLMHVYLDAVFYPNIYQKEEIFRQEGWHYQLEKAEDELTYNGVVYNEMKGAYSSPDDVLERRIMNSLFPDNTYAYESGGDPQNIPELSYEEYLDFHRRYYHPSNSYIYLYGDMDFAERLNWLDEQYLSDFAYQPVDSAIALQEPFAERKVLRSTYPVAAEDPIEHNTYLAENFVIGTSLDTRLATAFAVLNYVLLEAPGAPLKEALLDAGIGEDVYGSYDSGIRQPVFSVIAKGADAEQSERFAGIIEETLTKLVESGINEKAVLAAVNIMDFRFREADYGSYPKGLIYGLDVFDSWLYDDDMPFDYLRQTEDFAFLKQQTGTGYFEKLIQTYLLDNQHATMLIAEPERGLATRAEEETKQKLAAYKATLTEQEIEALVDNTEKLRIFQETPSTPEELEVIPMLSRSDMRRSARELQNEVLDVHGVHVISHPYQTNGIAYIQVLLGASGVAREDLPYLGILRGILGMVSTKEYSYDELFNEINLHTGGITPGLSVYPKVENSREFAPYLGISCRTLKAQIPYCFEMMEEILFTSDLSEEKRLQEMTAKMKSRRHSRLSEAGHVTAATRSQAHISGAAQFNDAVEGLEFYRTIEPIAEDFESNKEQLKSKLRSILDRILQDKKLLISYTGDQEGLELMKSSIAHLAQRLGISEKPETAGTVLGDHAEENGDFDTYKDMQYSHVNEGFKTSAKVQYVARSGNFRDAGFAYTGALRVLRTIMSYDYLWNHVRVVGGAYGCSGSFSRTGETAFVSYRDPHLTRTNTVYEGIPAYLESFTVDERDMTKYVIGTVSDMDVPLNPSALGARSMSAYMSGITYEMLQRERDQVLDITQEDIRALAPLTKAVLEQKHFCVVGSEDKLEAEKELFDKLESL